MHSRRLEKSATALPPLASQLRRHPCDSMRVTLRAHKAESMRPGFTFLRDPRPFGATRAWSLKGRGSALGDADSRDSAGQNPGLGPRETHDFSPASD